MAKFLNCIQTSHKHDDCLYVLDYDPLEKCLQEIKTGNPISKKAHFTECLPCYCSANLGLHHIKFSLFNFLFTTTPCTVLIAVMSFVDGSLVGNLCLYPR